MEDPRVAGSPRRLIVVAWAWPGPPGRLDTETQVPARQDGSEGGRRGTGTRQKRMVVEVVRWSASPLSPLAHRRRPWRLGIPETARYQFADGCGELSRMPLRTIALATSARTVSEVSSP